MQGLWCIVAVKREEAQREDERGEERTVIAAACVAGEAWRRVLG